MGTSTPLHPDESSSDGQLDLQYQNKLQRLVRAWLLAPMSKTERNITAACATLA